MKKKSPLVVTLGETIFEWSFPLKSEYRTDAESFELTIEDLPPPNASRWESQAIELAINGKSQLIGRVDVTESKMVVRGRDYIAELVECDVDSDDDTDPEDDASK